MIKRLLCKIIGHRYERERPYIKASIVPSNWYAYINNHEDLKDLECSAYKGYKILKCYVTFSCMRCKDIKKYDAKHL